MWLEAKSCIYFSSYLQQNPDLNGRLRTEILSCLQTVRPNISHITHSHVAYWTSLTRTRAHTLKWIQPSSAHCRDLSRSGSQLTDPITAEVSISSLDLLQPDAALNVFDLRRWVWISSHDNARGGTIRGGERQIDECTHGWHTNTSSPTCTHTHWTSHEA